MLLIPAIDLKEGKCVRLRQGRMDDTTVYSDDPVAMAGHWAEQGCRRLHVVDLDGAFAGEPRNREAVEKIVMAISGIPVQIGGGIRTDSMIEAYLEAGAQSVIVGTQAVIEPEFLARSATRFPDQVFFGLDARDGKVATEGWDKTSEATAVDLARSAAELPIAGVVYTDIERDGMMTGLNIDATRMLAVEADVRVVASGGVTEIDDLEKLKTAFADCEDKLIGAITGRAIYEGRLDFRAGQALLDA